MHKSRLAGFIIDCNTPDLDTAAAFWSEALGLARRSTDATDPGYVELEPAAGALHVEVQHVSHPSRVHLDIETDDIDAEVERLEALGAKRLARIKTWWVMEAPSGQRFCVIRVQEPARFAASANTWGS